MPGAWTGQSRQTTTPSSSLVPNRTASLENQPRSVLGIDLRLVDLTRFEDLVDESVLVCVLGG